MKGPKNLIRNIESWLYPGVRYTERIFKEFVRQNPRDQTFSSLCRKVRYIRGSLYRDSTMLHFFPLLPKNLFWSAEKMEGMPPAAPGPPLQLLRSPFTVC